MGCVQDLIEIFATLLIVTIISIHNSAMVSLKQSLRHFWYIYPPYLEWLVSKQIKFDSLLLVHKENMLALTHVTEV